MRRTGALELRTHASARPKGVILKNEDLAASLAVLMQGIAR
jgi:hypothetical protein